MLQATFWGTSSFGLTPLPALQESSLNWKGSYETDSYFRGMQIRLSLFQLGLALTSLTQHGLGELYVTSQPVSRILEAT